MGEIADMMLDGDLCQVCGEWMGDGDGYARTCAGCSQPSQGYGEPRARILECPDPHCKKKFKREFDRDQHHRDAHVKKRRR